MMMSAPARSLSSYGSSDGDPVDYVDDISDTFSDSVLSSQSTSDTNTTGTRAVPRRLRPLNLLPFTPWVIQRLNQCNAPNLNAAQFHKRLQVVDSHIRADCFVYASPTEFRQGKLLLLRLWKRMLFDDQGQFTIRYASLVLALTQRYEFDLIHMHSAWRRGCEDGTYSGLMVGDPFYMEENNGPGQCLARAYHCILARTAQLIFTHETSLSLRIMMAAVAFFRLPTLCAPLIDAAADGGDPDDKNCQTRSTCNDIQDDVDTFAAMVTQASRARLSDQAQFFKFNPSLFNWVNISVHSQPRTSDEYAFLDVCRRDLGFDDEAVSLLTAADPFCQQLGHDTECLHSFIAAVVAHVVDVAHGPVQWTCVPGLWPLLSAAIRNLQGIRPLAYPPKVRRCISQYLHNPDMLQFVVRACLEATSLYDKFEINAALDMIESWMATASTATIAGAEKDGSSSLAIPLPSSFCMNDFMVAIELLLKQDQFQVLVKTLTFLYSVAGRFVGNNRTELLHDLIVGRLFRHLFLHWSPEVRRRFHYLIVYKFNRCGLGEPPPLPPSISIRSRHSSGRITPVASPSNRPPSSWSLMRSSLSWLSSTLGGSVSSVIATGRQALPLSLSILTLPSIGRKSSPATSLSETVSSIQKGARHRRQKRSVTSNIPESFGAFSSPPLVPSPRPTTTGTEVVPAPPYNPDLDLQPHACVLIRTKLDADSAAQDHALIDHVHDHIEQIRKFAADPAAVPAIDIRAHAYAEAALGQYDAICAGYQRLQRRRPLRFGEVLAPELSYEIVDATNIIDNLALPLSSPPSASSSLSRQRDGVIAAIIDDTGP